MPAKNRVPVTVWLRPEEKSEVVALARQARLSISDLVRRLATGRALPDVHRHEAVIALVKVNADQARLGNLLRMALSDADFKPPDGVTLERLFDTIRETQSILKTKIEEL
ncbi:plasmid mobilization protein [Varunaivibrio sulfuroxidans]|uniref:Ribbon-helix-helix CopG family protein n=1 Tax=Varunaivibrio sulfuroxidans TaxID=1773489 RepID=A0A4R3J429_9PROT|nr:hypothetical protein [Varunaivibrio sulfuroxidans]TCS59952.1 hypothetical protein EDD55_1143 [Varunaivibrio sulfuroxidans]WES31764.1 hypothetical protein P3M64_05195 [Varunaivibrio sulfuroxidans]